MVLNEFIRENESIETLFTDLAPGYHTFADRIKKRQSLYKTIDLIYQFNKISYKIAKAKDKRSSHETEVEVIDKLEKSYEILNDYLESIEDRNVKELNKAMKLSIEDDRISMYSDNKNVSFMISEANKVRDSIEKEREIIAKSSIINLVINVETLISSCLRDYLKLETSKIEIMDKKLSLRDLRHSSNGYDQVRDLAVEKTIEDYLRKDFKELIKDIENKIFNPHKKKDRSLINHEFIDDVYETFQLRHLYIHNNGYYSSNYVSKTDRDVHVGNKVDEDVDGDYFNSRLKAFNTFGIDLYLNFESIIFDELYKNNQLESIDKKCGDLNDLSLMLLRNGHYEEASNISRFLIKKGDDSIISHVNNLIAYRLSEYIFDEEDYKKSLEYIEDKYNEFHENIDEVNAEEDDKFWIYSQFVGCAIVLEKEDSYEMTISMLEYARKIDYPGTMDMLYWPLLKLVAVNNSEFIDYRDELIYNLIKGDESNE